MSTIKDRSFYIADLFDIYKKHLKWVQTMPRVKPFYTIKCNQLPEILALLASLGTGFCCTNKQEIEQVLAIGVNPANIIYSNPCKTRLFIKHAKNVQVDLMTFDNELELRKVAQLHPDAKLVLRIEGMNEANNNSDDQLNIKVGANLDQCYELIKLAKQLGLNVVGVSFHNGANCQDAETYYQSIASCKSVFEMARELGHNMSLLNIGGGFPGYGIDGTVSFEELCAGINRALDTFFPIGCGVNIIAEPGRFYVASAMTFVTKVINKQVVYDDKLDRDCYMYSLGDGIYGAFNDLLLDERTSAQPQLLDENSRSSRKMRPSIMCGPTPDPMDCIKRDFVFPELQVGEWVVFKNKGAYTCCLASSMNDLRRATIIIANNKQLE